MIGKGAQGREGPAKKKVQGKRGGGRREGKRRGGGGGGWEYGVMIGKRETGRQGLHNLSSACRKATRRHICRPIVFRTFM